MLYESLTFDNALFSVDSPKTKLPLLYPTKVSFSTYLFSEAINWLSLNAFCALLVIVIWSLSSLKNWFLYITKFWTSPKALAQGSFPVVPSELVTLNSKVSPSL